MDRSKRFIPVAVAATVAMTTLALFAPAAGADDSGQKNGRFTAGAAGVGDATTHWPATAATTSGTTTSPAGTTRRRTSGRRRRRSGDGDRRPLPVRPRLRRHDDQRPHRRRQDRQAGPGTAPSSSSCRSTRSSPAAAITDPGHLLRCAQGVRPAAGRRAPCAPASWPPTTARPWPGSPTWRRAGSRSTTTRGTRRPTTSTSRCREGLGVVANGFLAGKHDRGRHDPVRLARTGAHGQLPGHDRHRGVGRAAGDHGVRAAGLRRGRPRPAARPGARAVDQRLAGAAGRDRRRPVVGVRPVSRSRRSERSSTTRTTSSSRWRRRRGRSTRSTSGPTAATA